LEKVSPESSARNLYPVKNMSHQDEKVAVHTSFMEVKGKAKDPAVKGNNYIGKTQSGESKLGRFLSGFSLIVMYVERLRCSPNM
jgi:hypothetical protein